MRDRETVKAEHIDHVMAVVGANCQPFLDAVEGVVAALNASMQNVIACIPDLAAYAQQYPRPPIGLLHPSSRAARLRRSMK